MNENRLKVFISAYACEPDLGSEIGVGWHWVLEMSKYFELWVLTRKSNKQHIENWLAKNKEYENIHFLYFDLPYWLRFWKKGLRGVRVYYTIWQWCINSIVKCTMKENEIKIFHHLTYGNGLGNVSSYGQRQFFVWGPIGGVETIPAEYSKYYDFKSRMREWLRRMAVKSLKWNLGFNRRCKRASLILCKTEATRIAIPEKQRGKALLVTDVAVDMSFAEEQNFQPSNGNMIKYISVGRLEAWRGFDILIEAFGKAVEINNNMHLSIIGDGQDRERLDRLIEKRKLSKYITLTGMLSMEDYYEQMQQCNVVINCSLKEGAVTVSFDSMALGKPLICVDTGGYTRYFSSDYAVVIPLESRNKLITELQSAIINMCNTNERNKLGKQSQIAGKQFTWEKRGEEIFNIYSRFF